MDLTVIFGALAGLLATGLVWVWKKWGNVITKHKLVMKLLESLSDGELTDEEAKEIIEELRKLLGK